MDINKARAKRRLRRRRHIRKQIFGSPERPRLTVTRSHRHIHCQVVLNSFIFFSYKLKFVN